MSDVKDNRGATLAELMITIAIGSLITLAAVTVFLLGLRIYHQSTETALRQNEIQMGLTVMERLVAEGPVTGVDAGAVLTTGGNKMLHYDADNDVILSGSGAQILENVTDFSAVLEGELITFTVAVGEELRYESSVYCRVIQEEPSEEGNAVIFSAGEEPSIEEIITGALSDAELTPNVRAFLRRLTSQLGSTGRIRTEEGDGEYYSEWYIGSYAANPSWNADTPWCACFVSWALDACSGYLQGEPARFANVDKFWAEFVTADNWKTADPEVGDIIFFDWIVDDDHDPQHVGVVLAESEDWIYTVEGNSNGVVAVRKYAADDARILGYGSLNWR